MSTQADVPVKKVNFQVGDKVRWYRYSGAVTGTVLKSTPKRVQILAEMPDGRLKIRYVTARRLAKLVPRNKSYGRTPSDEFMSKEVQRRVNRIGPTLAGQILSGLVSLILGGLLITLVTIVDRELLQAFGSKEQPFTAMFFGSLGLITVTVCVIKAQFERALTPIKSFRTAVRYSGWGLLCIVGFCLITMLPIFVIHGASADDFLWMLIEILSLVVVYVAMAIIIGIVQYSRLEFEKFDLVEHLLLLDNKAAITACQFGIMPYRARISAFWTAMMFAVISLLCWGMNALIWQDDAVIMGAIMIIVSSLFTVMSLQFFEFAFVSRLDSLESHVTEKQMHSAKGSNIYLLVCKGRKFTTDARTWRSICPGEKYLLWYAPLWFARAQNRVVAAEPRSSFFE